MKIGLAVRVTLDLFPDTLGVLDPRDIKLDSGRVLRIEADKRSRLRGARFKALARKDIVPTAVWVANLGPFVLEAFLYHDAEAFGEFGEDYLAQEPPSRSTTANIGASSI